MSGPLVLPPPRLASHRYRLKPCGDVVTGRTSDGRLFATAPHFEGTFFVFFAADGKLLSWKCYDEATVFPGVRAVLRSPNILPKGRSFPWSQESTARSARSECSGF